MTHCPICGQSREPAFKAQVLAKYEVQYWYCSACGLLQTEEPYWLDEAYRDAISDLDVGLVSRNITIARVVAPLLTFGLPKHSRILDVGGGYGLFVRLMRDTGLDFWWSDPACENLFARAHEVRPEDRGDFAAITAFEVFEHVPNPREWLEEQLSMSGARTVVFTQETFTGPPPPPSWWYYAFESGQHISFYQPRTLLALARTAGLRYWHHGPYHVFTDHPRVGRLLKLVASPRTGLLMRALAVWRRDSLMGTDFEAARTRAS